MRSTDAQQVSGRTSDTSEPLCTYSTVISRTVIRYLSVCRYRLSLSHRCAYHLEQSNIKDRSSIPESAERQTTCLRYCPYMTLFRMYLTLESLYWYGFHSSFVRNFIFYFQRCIFADSGGHIGGHDPMTPNMTPGFLSVGVMGVI